jgi:CRP-like cAMP-binding protein
MLGLSVLLRIDSVPCRYFAQVGARALRMKADVLNEESSRSDRLRMLLFHYLGTSLAQLMQVCACNSLHSVEQCCCRWLLMCQDRIQMKELPLIHDFLIKLLGVRRASVTEVLHRLQENQLIDYKRGRITVVDRECFGGALLRVLLGYHPIL